MDTSAIDFAALALGLVVAGLITACVWWASREGSGRRMWLTALAVAAVLTASGWADLAREQPRETHLATVLIGIPLTVVGAVGLQRALRRTRAWVRWTVVFLGTLLLLFSGLLIGGAVVPRFVGG